MQPVDFSFHHPCGLHITRDLREEDAAPHATATRRLPNGFAWHDLPAGPVEGGELAASLCHHLGKLVSVSARVGDPAVTERGWEDWTEAEERACVKRTEKWLRALGYRQGNTRWYEIRVGYDARSGSGEGVIRYHG